MLSSRNTYCGEAPIPAELAGRWNGDPVLMIVLATCALLFYFGQRAKTRPAGERYSFAAGLIVLLVAFVSPLCAWSSALFSIRVVHHLLLVGVAAPLLA